jgi:hypothetical protein
MSKTFSNKNDKISKHYTNQFFIHVNIIKMFLDFFIAFSLGVSQQQQRKFKNTSLKKQAGLFLAAANARRFRYLFFNGAPCPHTHAAFGRGSVLERPPPPPHCEKRNIPLRREATAQTPRPGGRCRREKRIAEVLCVDLGRLRS